MNAAIEYTSVGLMTLGGELLAGASVSVVWPVGTALTVALAASVAAAALFRTQEI